MALAHHGRFPYRPVHHEPGPPWPNGANLAVYIGLNLEHFAFAEGLGAELAPGGPQPDVLNYAWREYGNRVGVWRMIDLFDSLSLPCTALLNASLLDHSPEIADAFARRGDEIAGHGRTNSERQSALSEAEEQALIAEATERIVAHFGVRRPAGSVRGSPKATQRPTSSRRPATGTCLTGATTTGRHGSPPAPGRSCRVPYPQEINDIPAIAVRRAGAAEFADMIVDQFDEMREQAQGAAAGDGHRAPPLHRRAAVSPAASAAGAGAHRLGPGFGVDHHRRCHRRALGGGNAG